MKLYWMHIWKSEAYRKGTAADRRMIEIRFVASRALKQKRDQRRVTQKQLAQSLGAAQATISKIEQASDKVSLDYYFLAMIALEANDEEIVAGVNAGADIGIQRLRARAQLKFFPRAASTAASNELRRWGWRTRINSFFG